MPLSPAGGGILFDHAPEPTGAPLVPSGDTLKLIGRTIADKYAVESVVGEGGFATVYKAMHIIWKRPVALKVFKALGDFSEKDRQKLLDEFIQ